MYAREPGTAPRLPLQKLDCTDQLLTFERYQYQVTPGGRGGASQARGGGVNI